MKQTLRVLLLTALFSCTKTGVELHSSSKSNVQSNASVTIDSVCFDSRNYTVTITWNRCNGDSEVVDYSVNGTVVSTGSYFYGSGRRKYYILTGGSDTGKVRAIAYIANHVVAGDSAATFGQTCNQ